MTSGVRKGGTISLKGTYNLRHEEQVIILIGARASKIGEPFAAGRQNGISSRHLNDAVGAFVEKEIGIAIGLIPAGFRNARK
jgi:hypothetical protein